MAKKISPDNPNYKSGRSHNRFGMSVRNNPFDKTKQPEEYQQWNDGWYDSQDEKDAEAIRNKR